MASRWKAAVGLGLGAIVLLTSWIGPAIWRWREGRRHLAARADVFALRDAALAFFAEQGMWPTARRCEPFDCRFGREIPNAEVLNVLRAVSGPGNEGHALNRDRTVFLSWPRDDAYAGRLDEAGNAVDPWGTAYQIVLDTDLNGVCAVEHSVYHGVVGEGAMVWSCGPDRRSDTPDDICSWRRRPSRTPRRY